jgi:hypothetical protein
MDDGVLHGLLQRVVYAFPPQMYEGLDMDMVVLLLAFIDKSNLEFGGNSAKQAGRRELKRRYIELAHSNNWH